VKFSETLLRNRFYNRNRFDFGSLFVHARWETNYGVLKNGNTKDNGFEKNTLTAKNNNN